MIDFACKQFVIDDIIKCSFGLTKAELKLLNFLAKNLDDHFTTEELAKRFSFDISTVQRAMKKLHEQEIVLRSQENLEGGGYLFSYQFVNRVFFEKKFMAILSSWINKVDGSLVKWP